MALKSEVYDCFVRYHQRVTKQTGKHVLRLRTDNALEFMSRRFAAYCAVHGIEQSFTAPYTPQQNGKAERMNRTLLNMVRTWFVTTGFPYSLWGELVMQAAVVINMLPTKGMVDSADAVTPYESWYKCKPDVARLRTIGCNAYAHLVNKKGSKVTPNAVKCRLLGFDTERKCYRLWREDNNTVILSRDVAFDENTIERVTAGPITQAEHNELVSQLSLPIDVEGDQPAVVDDVEGEQLAVVDAAADDLGDEAEGEQLAVVDAAADDDRGDEAEEHELPVVAVDRPARQSSRSNRGVPRAEPGFNCQLLTYEDTDFSEDKKNVTLVRSEKVQYKIAAEALMTELHIAEPSTYRAAVQSEHGPLWQQAMDKEYQSLMKCNTWDLTPLPKGRKAIGNKWVFKLKFKSSGEVERFKARMCAQGFGQVEGIDYDETFAPVAKFTSIRTVLAIAAEMDLDLTQMDVDTAFLYGVLEDEIYMVQPEGFIKPGSEHLVCKLKRGLYGLKQSPRIWNWTLDTFLREQGLIPCNSDPCIYVCWEDDKLLIVAVYVDDLIIASNDQQLKDVFVEHLKAKFSMKDLGELHWCLGMRVLRDRDNRMITLDQEKYIGDILRRFGMEESKPQATPAETGLKLTKRADGEALTDVKQYMSAVGSLMYAMIGTRPDIAWIVSQLSQHLSNPTQQHWNAVKRVMRYLKGTAALGLCFRGSSSQISLVGYSDADWAGDLDSRRSTTGYVFQLSGAAVSWSSKRQKTVALSSTEAEYMALAAATQEALWLRVLLKEMGFEQTDATVIKEDNQSCIALAKNPNKHQRTKHIDIRYHFVREQVVERSSVKIEYCSTDLMVADIATKALCRVLFERQRDAAMGLTQ